MWDGVRRARVVGLRDAHQEGLATRLAILPYRRSLSDVPLVEAAHLRAAVAHDRSAVIHEELAELFDGAGDRSLARDERARARLDRDGAALERESARLRRERNASRPG
jgi:hypothetical protein